jgi:D-alanyl-D-alanine carboxypeptidase
MTAYVVFDLMNKFGLEWNKVIIKILTSSTTPYLGGTSAQLLPGDKICVRELMFAMMLPSGNDAA